MDNIGTQNSEKVESLWFKKVKNKNIKQNVQEQIMNYIVSAKLTEGMPLPTEKELTEHLGLGRGALREALTGLETLGAIEVRHGIGRFVGKFDINTMVKNILFSVQGDLESYRNLLEIRIYLETVSLLTELPNFEKQDLREFRNCLVQQEKRIKEGCDDMELIQMHADFHCLLLKRSYNKILIDLTTLFSSVQMKLRFQLTELALGRSTYIQKHTELVNKLEHKDPELVKQALKDHYSGVVEWVKQNGLKISTYI